MLSNIDMQNRKAGFAIPLNKTSRLLGAIEITSTKLLGVIAFNTILLSLMEEDGELTPEQRRCHSLIIHSSEKRKQIKTFFWKTYNDEEAICAYLNKKISIRYFKKNKSRGETDTDVSIRNILESSIGIDMFMQD